MPDASPARLTAEELHAHPDRDCAELVRGALRVSQPPGIRHGAIAVRLAAKLEQYAQPRGLGTVLVESGYVLRRDPDTVRGPDVSFISSAHLRPDRLPIAFFPGGPDLAVEIRSAADRPGEIEEKVADYRAAGTRLVWVVDPFSRLVTIHRLAEPVPEVRTTSQDLDGEEVIPGFRRSIAELLPEA